MLLRVNPSPYTLAGLQANLDEAVFVVLGLPLEATSTLRPGSRLAPLAIREASLYVSLWSERVERSVALVPVHDAGDAVIEASVRDTLDSVAELVEMLVSRGKRVILVGGEHTITLSVVKAMVRRARNPLLIVFDAHLDMREVHQGAHLAHSTVTLRAAEQLGGQKVVVIGARALSERELERAKRLGVRVIRAREFEMSHIQRLAREVENVDWLHISIDIDALDPIFAPGATTPEPEGLTPTQLYDAIHELAGNARFATLDLTEYTPLYDPTRITAVYAAKAVIEYIAAQARTLSL
ncbi:agmatinase [Pyrolobus fumarii]|nr:agmatinase [Pyrolobus fumarii]